MTIDWGYWLMEIGAWLISIGLTIGIFTGFLWCVAKLCEIGDRQ
jgi:hypothetical protein